MAMVINYDLSMKNYIDELDKTKHVTHKSFRKTSVTLHHNAGRLSHDGVLNVWKVRPASAHFNIDGQGTAAQFVRVNEYAWATGNTEGNRSTISIEMANSAVGGNWPVATITWQRAARLAGWLFSKVIGQAPSKSNFHYHSHWSSTACAGPYMDSIYSKVLAEAQKWYKYYEGGTATKPSSSTTSKPVASARKSNTQIASEVWAGKWGTGQDRINRLKRAGYNPTVIQNLVNRGVGRQSVSQDKNRKSISQIADEVIAGKWGNGTQRVARLKRAGYDAAAVQREVNRKLR